MTKFIAAELALEIIRSVRDLIPVIGRYDKKLAGQAREATDSISLNVREGNRRTGGDRIYLFTVAAGSADELAGALKDAVAWRYLGEAQIARPLDLIDQELAILYRLCHPRGSSAR